jgi:hypothetical protein
VPANKRCRQMKREVEDVLPLPLILALSFHASSKKYGEVERVTGASNHKSEYTYIDRTYTSTHLTVFDCNSQQTSARARPSPDVHPEYRYTQSYALRQGLALRGILCTWYVQWTDCTRQACPMIMIICCCGLLLVTIHFI